MVVIQEIVAALWQHDFAALANPTLWALYIWSCSQPCFWKTVCCPPHFLPGDSLLLLAGRSSPKA